MSERFSVERYSTSTGYVTLKIIKNESQREFLTTIYTSPYSNCQMFCIASFVSLVSFCGHLEDLNELLKLIKLRIGKPLLSVDVEKSVFNKIKTHIKIHAKMEYTNFTSSKMVMVLIDLRK